MVTSLSLEAISIGRRLRSLDEAKVAELANSIRTLGLLNPVTVAEDGRLLAGRHRLEACRRLGLDEIPVTVLPLSGLQAELAEIDENLIRNELSHLERAEHLARRKQIYEVLHPEAKHGTAGARAKHGAANEIVSFAEDTAAKIGRTARSVQHDIQIATHIPQELRDAIRPTPLADNKVELLKIARLTPEEQQPVVERIIRGQAACVRQASNQVRADALREAPPPLPTGPFQVIVADPPWHYESRQGDATHRGAPPYPTMTLEEIWALPVPDIAADDAVLWLWTTNAHLWDARHVFEAWGFTYKTILTWVKDKMGVGDWLRGQTEHCVLAIRGRPVVHLTNQTTALRAPARQHSRKPDEFYSLVESLCPGAKIDLFAREARPGWAVWGGEADRFGAAEGGAA